MTSQALGRRDLAEVLRLLVRSSEYRCGDGLLFFVLQKWLIGCGLWAMSPEADVVELARRYRYVCIWGARQCSDSTDLRAGLSVCRNTRIPMTVSLTQNVVNIIASLLLVFVGGMTVERRGARNGHCPMVGIPDGMSVLSLPLSPVKQSMTIAGIALPELC